MNSTKEGNKYIPAGIEEGEEVAEVPVEVRREVPRVSDLEKEKQRGERVGD